MPNDIQKEYRWLAAVTYLVWPLSLLIVFTQLKSERFLRFHGYQSLALGISGLVLYLMLGLFFQLIPFFGWLLFNTLVILWFLFEIFLAFRCFQGELFRVPFIYDLMRGVMN
ncbi:MAG TPA: DUF4870 domain-containing protein [Bacillota bacterium]|nr:DUF4870 domain-containing protein [Bacillota bacterium]